MCTTYYKTGSSEIIACTVTDRAALALFTVHYHVRVRICMRRCMGLNERSEISPGRPLSSLRENGTLPAATFTSVGLPPSPLPPLPPRWKGMAADKRAERRGQPSASAQSPELANSLFARTLQ